MSEKTPQSNKMLQEIRKEKIPDFITKYQKLIDDTFKAVSNPMPVFTNIENEKMEIVQTAEQQIFACILTRKGAVDYANKISMQINELERELYDPTFFNAKDDDDDDEKVTQTKKSTSPAKRFAKQD